MHLTFGKTNFWLDWKFCTFNLFWRYIDGKKKAAQNVILHIKKLDAENTKCASLAQQNGLG
jgi:hypothetical protein